MGIFNRTKKITVYAVTSKKVPNKFLTINDNKLDALEYAMKILRLEHQDHYDAWCRLKQVDPENLQVWLEYFINCVSDEEKTDLQVIKIKYTVKNIAAMLRMLGNCYPLGCSFDTILEQEYFAGIAREKNTAKEVKNPEENFDVEKEDILAGDKHKQDI